MIEYAFHVEREGRRRLFYWEVTRNGTACAAGFQKTRAGAEQRAAESIQHHKAVDATISGTRVTS